MSKAFTPEVGTRPMVVREGTEIITNYPEVGSPIVASAGPSRVVGRVEKQNTEYSSLCQQIRISKYGFEFADEWLHPSEWSIEILTEGEYAELIAPFEVVAEAEALVSA